jgi:hypothetical protein
MRTEELSVVTTKGQIERERERERGRKGKGGV